MPLAPYVVVTFVTRGSQYLSAPWGGRAGTHLAFRAAYGWQRGFLRVMRGVRRFSGRLKGGFIYGMVDSSFRRTAALSRILNNPVQFLAPGSSISLRDRLSPRSQVQKPAFDLPTRGVA